MKEIIENTKRKFNVWGLIIWIFGVGLFQLARYLFNEVNGILGIILGGISLVLMVFGAFTLFVKKNIK